jgi:hypothetical protein
VKSDWCGICSNSNTCYRSGTTTSHNLREPSRSYWENLNFARRRACRRRSARVPSARCRCRVSRCSEIVTGGLSLCTQYWYNIFFLAHEFSQFTHQFRTSHQLVNFKLHVLLPGVLLPYPPPPPPPPRYPPRYPPPPPPPPPALRYHSHAVSHATPLVFRG